MSKIEISQAAEILKKHKIEPSTLREIVEEMNILTQPEGDGATVPPIKKQFVVLISDPAGTAVGARDLVAWVLQIPEEASPHSLTDRIFKAAYDFNASKRGRLLPVKSVGEAIECVGGKFFREADVWPKTKTPVQVLTTDNVLPRDEFKIEKVDRRTRQ